MRRGEDIVAFVAERVRRGTYSPEDVRRQLFGRKNVDQATVQRLMEAAANRKPEPPMLPIFTYKPPKPKPQNYAKIALSLVSEYDSEGKAMHTYWGAWHLENRLFVKSFTGKDIEFTREEKEAYKFTDDHMCDACMAKLIMEHHAFTIALWERGSQMVHYPGEHWWDNGFLVPSFINRKGVSEFQKEGIAFDRRRGWYKKEKLT